MGAREILIKCGIPSIENVEATDTNATVDGLISFREKIDDDRVFWFTIEKRKIFYVALNGEDLYDADKGGFLKKFEDVHIPDIKVSYEEYMKLQNLSEKLLDKYFGFDVRNYKAWGVGRSDNKYMTRCKASDGKILTNNWIYCYIWYEKQNEEFVPTDMKIDGKIVNVR